MSKARHILGLSGGKDSAALAIYMKMSPKWSHVDLEYVFTDTHKELPETYDFLDKLGAFLGKKITRVNTDMGERGFDHWLQLYGGYLPSPKMRWCTRKLKLKPFEDYVGDDDVVSYVGIRADENREGYVSTKPNIRAVFPFKEDGIEKSDVFRILDESGVGTPEYYKWRTRSGCYFCFFQRRSEWVGLMENHPDLFEKAKAYEKIDESTGERYTWIARESLSDLEKPERVAEIKANAERELARARAEQPNRTLFEVMTTLDDERDADERPCLVCDL